MPIKTIGVLATGPSLPGLIAGGPLPFETIAINNAFDVAPWADHLYAADWLWWHVNNGAPSFAGQRWSVSPKAGLLFDDITVLGSVRSGGLSFAEGVINIGIPGGANSGHQAINLAVLMGAMRIILIGFDLQTVDGEEHYFGQHAAPLNSGSNLKGFATSIATIAADAGGIEILNATPGSALEEFPMVDLHDLI